MLLNHPLTLFSPKKDWDFKQSYVQCITPILWLWPKTLPFPKSDYSTGPKEAHWSPLSPIPQVPKKHTDLPHSTWHCQSCFYLAFSASPLWKFPLWVHDGDLGGCFFSSYFFNRFLWQSESLLFRTSGLAHYHFFWKFFFLSVMISSPRLWVGCLTGPPTRWASVRDGIM